MKKNFLLMTEGATASHWISKTLSSLDNVFCSHGYTNPPTVYPHGYSLELEAKIRKEDRYKNKNFMDYYKLINDVRKEKYCGTIHLYNYSVISKILNNITCSSEIKKFKVASVTRHPILRVQSFYEHFIKIYKIDSLLRNDINEWVDNEVSLLGIKKYLTENFQGIDLKDLKVRAFICALGITNSATGNLYESTKRDISFYKYEEITSDKDVQENFVNFLFDGEVMYDENIFSSKKTNVHREVNLSESNCFDSWDLWKQDAFCHYFRVYKKFYEETCGYSLPSVY